MKNDLPTLIDNPDEKAVAVKVAIGGTGTFLYGITLNEIIGILTVAYLTLQIGLLLPKYYGMVKAWRSKAR